MLSRKILKALSLPRLSQSSCLPISTSCKNQNSNFRGPFKQYLEEQEDKPERKLKEWRESFKGKEPFMPMSTDNAYFRAIRTKIELTPWGIKKHMAKSMIQQQIDFQKFNPQRHEALGPDLSLAHFLISIGGKLRFKGNDKWFTLKEDKGCEGLPEQFDPNWVVTEIDARNSILYYEGLENFKNCPRVKWANFAGCENIDDWCVDRISCNFPFLEYLDLSDCPKVTERGLEALYKTGMLKTLIVTNNNMSAAFELTCMMLEDVVPGLTIEIRQPKEKIKPQINEE